MAKDKDDVTQEVTTRPGFSTHVTDAPDHTGVATGPSQRLQEEQAAGRASVRDAARSAAAEGYINPADADHFRAGAVAKVINEAKQERDREDSNPLPPGETPPGEVPSKGYTYVPPPGEALEADKKKMEEVARVAEAQEARVKQAREAEEAQVKETVDRANRGSGGNDSVDYEDKAARNKELQKEIDEERNALAKGQLNQTGKTKK